MAQKKDTKKKRSKRDETIVYRERKRVLFFGLPFSFTVYTIREDMITMDEGFFKRIENDCYMYKVQDVEMEASFAERIVGIGNVTLFTGDTTHPKLVLRRIKHPKKIKNYILEASEAARMKRRTLNTLDIGTGAMGAADPADLD